MKRTDTLGRAKAFVRVTPPVLIAVDGVACFIGYMKFPWREDFFWFHSELFGHSVVLLVYIVYFAYRYHVCGYTWLSVSTLIAINILNLVYYFLTLSYYVAYAGILTTYVILMLGTYVFKQYPRYSQRRVV